MNTPVYDFVSAYSASGASRLHMPGHKGAGPLGIEARDITEILGADVLYAPAGILRQSEENAAALFGTGRTLYSTEGSSHVIRAMLYLALLRWRRKGGTGRPVLLAARNAHKVLLYAAALLDFEIEWLYPEGLDLRSVCSCQPTAEALEKRLDAMGARPFAVYLTSPDYLGGTAELRGLAEVCRRFSLPLLVDNAHGAYTHFLPVPFHPMDCGAYLCADSAHKTLPCLTGAAYLHMSSTAAEELGGEADDALALFGSTSPSYLILQSLDLCNAYLAGDYRETLKRTVEKLDALKARLREQGVPVLETEPLKLTVDAAALGLTGEALAEALRRHGIEPEFSDLQFLVLMLTPENREEDYLRLEAALADAAAGATRPDSPPAPLRLKPLRRALGVREAIFAPHLLVPVEQALGRICGQPSVSCPPAVPIAVSGEVLDAEAVSLLKAYGIETVSVVDR